MQTTRQIARRAKRLFTWCLVDGLLDDGRTRLVVQGVLEANRRDGAATLSQFVRLVRLDRARHAAHVESAAPLPDDVRARVEADLSRVYGPGLNVSFAVAPALIGGMRIAVGSDVYDGSVRAALAALERSF